MSRFNREGKYTVATDSEVITLKQIPYSHWTSFTVIWSIKLDDLFDILLYDYIKLFLVNE